MLLTRGTGRLRLHLRRPGETPRLALTYLSLAGGAPKFSLDRPRGASAEHQELYIRDHWQDAELKTRLDVLDASADHLRLRVTSALAVTYEEQPGALGVHLLDAVLAPGAESPLVQWLLRRGAANLGEVADYLSQDQATARAQLDALVEKGVVLEERADR